MNKIASITTDGVVTESVEFVHSEPTGITAGVGNKVWFLGFGNNRVYETFYPARNSDFGSRSKPSHVRSRLAHLRRTAASGGIFPRENPDPSRHKKWCQIWQFQPPRTIALASEPDSNPGKQVNVPGISIVTPLPIP